jgi:sulfur relay protein TusB/DsrH
VLIQDAVLGYADWEGQLYACQEDLAARGVEGKGKVVDYDDLVRMIFAHDRVIMW